MRVGVEGKAKDCWVEREAERREDEGAAWCLQLAHAVSNGAIIERNQRCHTSFTFEELQRNTAAQDVYIYI
jgi:hypothetical protein